jgi:hypothetical protein
MHRPTLFDGHRRQAVLNSATSQNMAAFHVIDRRDGDGGRRWHGMW